MKKVVKKTKVNKLKLLLLIVVVFVIGFFAFKILKIAKNKVFEKKETAYVASISDKVVLYDNEFTESGNIIRGTKVEVKGSEIKDESSNLVYKRIVYNNEEKYIKSDNIVNDEKDVVLEKEMYVRTPVTLYKDSDSSKILSSIKKGEKLNIIGYNKLNNGIVDMYKVSYNDLEGYVYSKYLLDNESDALKNYDEDNTYQTHLSRTDKYYGGNAGNLDYYPYEKAKFDDNVMPSEVRSLYLNSTVLGNIDSYIELAKNSNINAFVVDIKDNTAPGYASLVMKEYSPTNYAKALNSLEDYKAAIKKIKDNGFYVIGRITTFKDSYYVTDHPEDAILEKNTNKPYKHNGSYWPTAYSRNVWEFNVELAKEAVTEMGFNEIQFDYVRFPDRTTNLEKSGVMDMRNTFNEEKAQAIQGFLMYACDEIHKLNAYVSADVFGESAHNYVTAYGQYWPAISNVVDVISAMPYPDHFNKYEYGFKEPVWTVPYKLLNYWGSNYAAIRQKEIPTPARVRTWIQTYDTIREPYIVYDSSKIADQIKGLYDAGLSDGYMTWNSSSNINKYKSISSAFKGVYKNE